jgi:sugar phosphate permease
VRRAADATLRNFIRLTRNRTLMTTILSQAALFFVLASCAYWLPFYLNRRFHLDVAHAGTVAGGVLVGGGLLGPLGGGWLADRWQRRSEGAHLKVGIIGFLLGSVFVTFALLAPSLGLFVPMLFLGVICLYLYAGPFTAISQNVVIPSLRASAVTLSLLLSHLLGDSYSPFVVGLLSDRLGGLQPALLLTAPTLLLVAAAVAALGLRTIGDDIRRAEETWAEAPLEPRGV